VLGGHGRRVANPLAHRRQVVLPHQLTFPAGPQVVEQSRPRCLAGTLDDAFQLRAEVQGATAALRDDVLAALFAFGEELQQVLPQFEEQRDDSVCVPLPVLQFRAGDADRAPVEVNVRPLEGEVLGGAAQTTKSTQGDVCETDKRDRCAWAGASTLWQAWAPGRSDDGSADNAAKK
jgi:hypothetical protein